MNRNDFRCMWRGQIVRDLKAQDYNSIAPVDLQGEGKERALLLLHGFSSTPAVFRELIPDLSQYDAIVAPALPGHAQSIDAFSKVHARDWVTHTELLCSELMQKYKKLDVLGMSLGGVLACHLSKQFPLHHLYLLAPALVLRKKIKSMRTLALILHRLGFRRIRNLAGNLHTRRHCELAYRQLPISTITEVLGFIDSFQFIPPTCPTDVFLGEHDDVVNSEAVADHFAHLTNASTHWLAHSAHVLPLDGDIDQILACMKENRQQEQPIT